VDGVQLAAQSWVVLLLHARRPVGSAPSIVTWQLVAPCNASRLFSLLQVQLAEVAGLRSALRDMAGASDGAAGLARLHQELGHWRGKESALRASFNRSEVERIMLEGQVGLWGD
jgi:hypothetical protein